MRLSPALLAAFAAVPAAAAQDLPEVELRAAEKLKFPASTDSNSPCHWDGDTLHLFTSAGHPFRSSGAGLAGLGKAERCAYDNEKGFNGGRWIECTWKEEGGSLYGWYHNEPGGVCPGRKNLTAPKIGAVVSQDNGATWKDLGFVLEAPPDSLNPATENRYFVGGNGDFSVMLDARKENLYFFISTYDRDVAEQGVSVARMKWADRDQPSGKVWKWHRGGWGEAGRGGHVTPVFPAKTDWHRKDADAFWGPSIHWNTHLETYVMLLNRTKDADWKQEGHYVAFNRDLSDPKGWSGPRKVRDGGSWYGQVVGLEKGGTDKLAGRVARFFVHGRSEWEIVFKKPGEK